MKLTYFDRSDYFVWAMNHTAGQLVEFFEAAIELQKEHPLPLGTLGYDEENDELFVRREPQ